jgi:hypothetical protein
VTRALVGGAVYLTVGAVAAVVVLIMLHRRHAGRTEANAQYWGRVGALVVLFWLPLLVGAQVLAARRSGPTTVPPPSGSFAGACVGRGILPAVAAY